MASTSVGVRSCISSDQSHSRDKGIEKLVVGYGARRDQGNCIKIYFSGILCETITRTRRLTVYRGEADWRKRVRDRAKHMESLANIDLFILKLIETKLGKSILRVQMLLAKLDSKQLFSLEFQQGTIIMCLPWVTLQG